MAKEVKKTIEVEDKTKTEVLDTVKDTKTVETPEVKEEEKVVEETKEDANNEEKSQTEEPKEENPEDKPINIEKVETPTNLHESKCTPHKRVRMGFGYLNGWNGMEY